MSAGLSKNVVAAFDFDKTLTDRDTTLEFLIFAEGNALALTKIATRLPYLIGFVVGKCSRQKVKEELLKCFFGGQTRASMEALGKDFAKKRLPFFLKNEALDRLRWHQAQGHRCILISASIDVYLKPWAQSYHFDDLICSQTEYQDDRFTGKLKGSNCWGPEKKRRLEELLGNRDEYILYAYGDSLGDRELLSMADYPFYQKFE